MSYYKISFVDNNNFDSMFVFYADLLPTMAKLITNPLYMLESFAACAAAYYVAGWIGYLPKYFEEQFLLSATMASVLAGMERQSKQSILELKLELLKLCNCYLFSQS